MRNKILIVSALMLMSTLGAFAEILTGYVYVNGNEVEAQYTKLTSNTVALGTGQNTCISQYTEGRLVVPGTVKINGTDYTVTEINSMAFRLCTKLTFVEIKENVKRIGNFAFVGCRSITEVALPASLENIGTGAFIDLPLKNILCAGATPAKWEYNDVFKFHENGISDDQVTLIGSSTRLTVPKNAIDTYRSALYTNSSLGWNFPDGWGRFSSFNDEYRKNWRIFTPEDLMALREHLAEQEGNDVEKATLEADLDMTNQDTWTYGLARYSNIPFTGTFDGQGHSIWGLKIINTNQNYLGLFDYFAGDTIRDLTLQDCEFKGKLIVGSLIGMATGGSSNRVVIEDVFSASKVSGGQLVGGLVGAAISNTNVTLVINRSVFSGNIDYSLDNTFADSYANYCGVGGLVGGVRNANIKNSAVWGGPEKQPDVSSGPFVGLTKYVSFVSNQRVNIDKCYQFNNTVYQSFDQYSPNYQTDKINMTNVVIANRDSYELLKETGDETVQFNYNNMKGLVMASVLGTNDWVYKYDSYPLPFRFESRWPEDANTFTIRPQGLKPRANGLSPVGTFPSEAWRSQLTTGDQRDFHYREFTTSHLWIDDYFVSNPLERPEMLPLGLAKITATNGVRYERELKAIYEGDSITKLPIYEMDEQGNFLEDAQGNPIETGDYIEFYEGDDFIPVGYSVYLPYDLTLSSLSKLYQPYKVTSEDGVTVVTFKEVEDNVIEAFKPYYVVVEKESEYLGTLTEEVSPQLSSNNDIDLGDFEFVGTKSIIYNDYKFDETAYILQNDGNWHLMPRDESSVYIPAFRSFFRAKGSSSASTLYVAFTDDTTNGIVRIRTIDADGTENYYDLSGRRLQGKPEKGPYIYNGKKFLNK